MNCSLAITDLKVMASLLAASIFIVIGVQYPVLYIIGWILMGYNLWVIIPDEKEIFMPAILGIIIASFIKNKYISIGLYMSSWVALGYITPNKIFAGLIELFAVTSYFFINKPYGVAGQTAALTLFSFIFSVPTLSTITNDLGPCVFDKIPLLKPYSQEIECVIKSGCFSKLLKMPQDQEARLKVLSDSIQCAADQCDSGIFKDISNKFDCYVSAGCFDDLLKNPPSNINDLLPAIGAIIVCINTKSKNCVIGLDR